MTIEECPGVNPKWQKRMKTWFKKVQEWVDMMNQSKNGELNHFVEHGFTESYSTKSRPRICYGQWSHDQTLYNYARMRLYEMAEKGTASRNAVFDAELAGRAYSAHYLGALVELYFDLFNRSNLPLTVLGIVFGCGEQAMQLARAYVRYRKELYIRIPEIRSEHADECQTDIFLELLLADFFGENLLPPDAKPLEDAVLSHLLQHWRNTDPAIIEQDCLKLCDYHTHDYVEEVAYIPYEILLIFKLRQQLGLENPQLDHPIMKTPLAILPEAIPFQYDDLIDRTRARMIKEGFDESVALGNDDWCKLRRKAHQAFKGGRCCDSAIPLEIQALTLAEQVEPHGLRVFSGLRSLGALHILSNRDADAVVYYERAMSIAQQNPQCDATLLRDEMVTAYRELGRTADAEAIMQRLS